MDKTEQKVFKIIAEDIGAGSAQVEAAVRLLDEGATVPFIARYRKEVVPELHALPMDEVMQPVILESWQKQR